MNISEVFLHQVDYRKKEIIIEDFDLLKVTKRVKVKDNVIQEATTALFDSNYPVIMMFDYDKGQFIHDQLTEYI